MINSDPEIYRIVEVPSDIRLESFADVINTAMGWEGYHMHLFQKGKTIYTTEESDDDFLFDPVKTVNSYSLSLGEDPYPKKAHILNMNMISEIAGCIDFPGITTSI